MGADKGYHLIEYVGVKGIVTDRLHLWVHVEVHPAFAVDAVDREDLHLAARDKGAQGVHQAKALVFQVIGRGRWYEQQGKTVMTVSGDGHVAFQPRTVPGSDPSLH